MGLPRFLFVISMPVIGSQPQQWQAGRVLDSGDPDVSWAAWRLVGGNNRELGRSGSSFPDEVAARLDAERLQGRLVGEAPRLCADLNDGGWTWRLGGPGPVLAVSGRSYARQREALYSAAQFMAHVPHAVLADGALVLPARPGRVVRIPGQWQPDLQIVGQPGSC